MQRISVFGIGYVGSVAAACLARDGHRIHAVDIDQGKVEAIASGRSPVVEPGLDAIIAATTRQGRLTATTDVAAATVATDISFICVGTPAMGNGSLDTRFVKRVAEQIGSALASKSSFHVVVVRSTTLPGTTEEVVIPALERASGKRAGIDFGVAYLPEFLREGSAIADYDHPGLLVIGALDARSRDALLGLHANSPIKPQIMEIRAAEAVKYACNAWHAVKISFANEIGQISRVFGIDAEDVMDAVCSDAKLNTSSAYLKPGYAFGGSCLPKDLRALRHRAMVAEVQTPLLNAALEVNENTIAAAYEMVRAVGKRRVGMFGLSFKPETDDLRYSPMVELTERLIGRGFNIKIFDGVIRPSRLTGANLRYVNEHLPHLANLLVEDSTAIVDHSEVVVIGNRQAAAPAIRTIEKRGLPVIDLVRVDRQKRSTGSYHGICW
jgi:GDP-mannose 6-dehydrogenase